MTVLLSFRSLLVCLLLPALLLVVQVLLSRLESRWPGLLLPAVSLLSSLVFCLNVADLGQGMAALLSALLTVFLLANVPTLLLLALYLICRRSRRRKRQMEHMNIQAL